MCIRIIIVEDQRMIRELLAEVLSHVHGIELLGAAASGSEAIELARRSAPDVVLLDVHLPDMDGTAVAAALKQAHPRLHIVAVSVDENPANVRAVLEAGVDGYVVKSSGLTELVPAIRAVAEGKAYLSPEIARAALGR